MIKTLSLSFTLGFFFITSVIGTCPVFAQEFRLPAPGIMVYLSPEFNPPILKGIKVHPDDPFRFDFILDKGNAPHDQLKQEANKLIKYFLASLTIPEKDLWVNLSPYEKDHIIPNSFGLTEMGRDMLAEDYMLKQITASLIYPEGEVGKKFWRRIYEEAAKRMGTTNIPVNTFNKVWIVPEKAVVYENAKAGTAYVVESKLKVMLEQDYLAFEKNQRQPGDMASAVSSSTMQSELGLNTKASEGTNYPQNINALGSQIVREIVIPELTKEVNEDKNFVQLRQVYNSLILATWYKKKIKDSILSRVYTDKNKVAGVNIDDPNEKQRIYEQYLRAFKKGVFNYIKEDLDPANQETMPRKYFSGGEDMTRLDDRDMTITHSIDYSQSTKNFDLVSMHIDAAMQAKKVAQYPIISLFRSIEAISGTDQQMYSYLKIGEVNALDHYATLMADRIMQELGNSISVDPQEWRVAAYYLWGTSSAGGLLSRKVADKLGLQTISMDIVKPPRLLDYAAIKTKEERAALIAGTVSLRMPGSVKGKSIILIDDSYVTGAVLDENIRVLAHGEPLSIHPFVIMNLSGSDDPSIEDRYNRAGLEGDYLPIFINAINHPDFVFTSKLLQYIFQLDDKDRETLLNGINDAVAMLNLYIYAVRDKRKWWVDKLSHRMEEKWQVHLPLSGQIHLSGNALSDYIRSSLEEHAYRFPTEKVASLGQKLQEANPAMSSQDFTAVLNEYGLGQIVESATLRSSDLEGGAKVLYVKTEQGEFVLKKYPFILTEEDLSANDDFMRGLKRQGFSYALPFRLQTKDGRDHITRGDSTYVLYSSLGHNLAQMNYPLEKNLELTARMLALYHRSAENLPVPSRRISGNYELSFAQPGLLLEERTRLADEISKSERLGDSPARREFISAEYQSRLQYHIQQFIRELPPELHDHLEKMAVHGDYLPKNILVDAHGQLSALIDFDDVIKESRLYDIAHNFGYLLRRLQAEKNGAITTQGTYNLMKDFLQAYTDSSGNQGFSESEIKALKGYVRGKLLYEIFFMANALRRSDPEIFFNTPEWDPLLVKELDNIVNLLDILDGVDFLPLVTELQQGHAGAFSNKDLDKSYEFKDGALVPVEVVLNAVALRTKALARARVHDYFESRKTVMRDYWDRFTEENLESQKQVNGEAHAPVFSFVIPTLSSRVQNLHARIREAAQSPYSSELLIVIADHENYKPGEIDGIQRELEASKVPARIIVTRNNLISINRNLGTYFAKGKYVIFWDDDVSIRGNASLSQLRHVLESNPEIGLVGLPSYTVNGTLFKPRPYYLKHRFHDDLILVNDVGGMFVATRQDIAYNTPYSDFWPNYGEDFHFGQTVRGYGYLAVLMDIHGSFLVHEDVEEHVTSPSKALPNIFLVMFLIHYLNAEYFSHSIRGWILPRLKGLLPEINQDVLEKFLSDYFDLGHRLMDGETGVNAQLSDNPVLQGMAQRLTEYVSINRDKITAHRDELEHLEKTLGTNIFSNDVVINEPGFFDVNESILDDAAMSIVQSFDAIDRIKQIMSDQENWLKKQFSGFPGTLTVSAYAMKPQGIEVRGSFLSDQPQGPKRMFDYSFEINFSEQKILGPNLFFAAEPGFVTENQLGLMGMFLLLAHKLNIPVRHMQLNELFNDKPDTAKKVLETILKKWKKEGEYTNEDIDSIQSESGQISRQIDLNALNYQEMEDFITNAAMVSPVTQHLHHEGGIDLTSDKVLTVQNNGQGIKFHLDPAMLAQLQNAPGFVPVIINIQPLNDLKSFLGVNAENNFTYP